MPLSICSACRLPSSSVITNLPCEECLASLLAAPEICAECLGFNCPKETCARPWLAVRGEADEAPLDLVFVIDLTSSMEDDIAGVKAAATEIVRSMLLQTYRDARGDNDRKTQVAAAYRYAEVTGAKAAQR